MANNTHFVASAPCSIPEFNFSFTGDLS